ncbi:hypothetical protein IMZ48_28880 [Candidatus Bathyarchaeota archaeon]|nr:hypothetical protein [Candidatus Bathyarchaeota archaeon]
MGDSIDDIVLIEAASWATADEHESAAEVQGWVAKSSQWRLSQTDRGKYQYFRHGIHVPSTAQQSGTP